jgi:ABC-2 type transport system ATP-binding protein
MNKILEIESLNKKYKNGRGIEDVNLCIKEGEILGLLGPNGSGKTTMMKCIAGLLQKDKGEIKICGVSLSDNFEKSIVNLGCLIEKPVSIEYLSSYKNLEVISRYYLDIKKERIDEVLNIVGLEKYKDEKVKNYSLGMKQRLSIAMSILHEPKLIILDEPTNGLDIEGTHELRNIITRLSKEFMISFLISSHLIHEIELICNRVLIIKEGRIIDENIVENIANDGQMLENYFIKKVKNV